MALDGTERVPAVWDQQAGRSDPEGSQRRGLQQRLEVPRTRGETEVSAVLLAPRTCGTQKERPLMNTTGDKPAGVSAGKATPAVVRAAFGFWSDIHKRAQDEIQKLQQLCPHPTQTEKRSWIDDDETLVQFVCADCGAYLGSL